MRLSVFLVRFDTPVRGSIKFSLFVRYFILSFRVSSCYNPLESNPAPRRFLPEKHH